ncbi:amidohydrolase [Marinobacter sp. 2_MG-2023]|uniref:amidohydrolase family protein n=1 Tax=Marinobacter sp. 2_MG-2023 TaxID=3062679 RepID=UPI0026E309A6|nr:amidohydrolase [Marinobacter sp. 2_MG-2023]MDO6443131.1 amidohydrolase [Marinobacter sp. 2_MG-2023]
MTISSASNRRLLLCADAVLPTTEDNSVIQNGAVLVMGDTIEAVGDRQTLCERAPDAEVRDYGRAILMPGLINTHSHSGLLRGTAEELPVWEWLQQYIDPMHRVLQPDEAEAASWLCYSESLLAGTTTSVDMWRYMAGSARAAEALGNRVVMVPYVGEAPGYDYFDTLDDNEALISQWHGGAGGRVNVWVGLEHQFYATEAACQRAVDLCNHYSTGLHTHSNESQSEIPEAMRRHGMSPVRSLEKLGLLSPEQVLLAHCVWLDDDELQLLADNNIGVAHNPSSNMKLASGPAPVEAMIAAGIAVGIGTDGEKENNNLDMFEEMKIASLLAKLRAMDAAAWKSWDVLRAATIEGARALGMEREIGSLEAGKQADVIAVAADTARMTPFIPQGKLQNLHHNLVHSVLGGDVTMTMVAGKILAENQILLSGDMPAYIEQGNQAAERLLTRRERWLATNRKGVATPV